MTKISLPARCMLVALLAPLVAGCGSNKPTTSTSTGASAAPNPATAAYAYARCIRAHGIASFPDPQVSTTAGGGRISQKVPASAGLSPKFPAAQKACQGILPPPSNSGGSEDQARRPYMPAQPRHQLVPRPRSQRPAHARDDRRRRSRRPLSRVPRCRPGVRRGHPRYDHGRSGPRAGLRKGASMSPRPPARSDNGLITLLRRCYPSEA